MTSLPALSFTTCLMNLEIFHEVEGGARQASRPAMNKARAFLRGFVRRGCRGSGA